MEPSTTTQLPDPEEIQRLLNRFQSLYDRSAELVLPEKTNWLLWLKESPNQNSWIQKFLFLSTSEWLINLSWFAASLVWIYIALKALGRSVPVNATQTPSDSLQLGSIIVLIISILTIPLAHSRALFFIFRDKRYRKAIRIVAGSALYVAPAIVLYFVIKPIDGITFRDGFLIWFMGFSPTLIFAVLLLAHAVIGLFIWTKKVVFFHRPIFNQDIKDILLTPIKTGQEEWWLVSIEVRERDLLSDWTSINLSNVEKRFWPTVLYLGVIGVMVDALANTTTIQTIVDSFFNWLEFVWHLVSLQSIEQAPTLNAWIYLGVIVVVIIIEAFILIIGSLLRTMLIQGFIAEACRWAEFYSKPKQSISPTLSPEPIPVSNRTMVGGWLRRFLKL